MKAIILILCTLPQLALAVLCSEMKNDLMAIEYKLQTSCVKPDEFGNCCANKSSKLCKSKQVIESQYNRALAELIIAQGLASIGMGIEANHNALNDLTEDQINKATKQISDMDLSLAKAEIISQALNPKTNEDFFNDYDDDDDDDDDDEEISVFIKEKCNKIKNTFCESVQKLKEEKNPHFSKALNTLKGFISADRQMRVSENKDIRDGRYKDYIARLEIQLGDEKMSVSKFKDEENGHYQKLMNIKRLLIERENSQNKADDEKILTLLNQTQDISVNYVRNNSGTRGAHAIIEQQFNKVFTQIDLPAVLNIESIQHNFQQTKFKIANGIKKHRITLDKDLKDRMKKLPNTVMNNECKNLNLKSCLRRLCEEPNNKTPRRCNKRFDNIGLDNEYQDLKSLDEHSKSQDRLSAAQKCLGLKTMLEKKLCLEKLSHNNKTDISKLKRNLTRYQVELSEQNDSEKFTLMNIQENMALNAYKQNGCLSQNDKYIQTFLGIKTDCFKSGLLATDTQAINLGLNGLTAMIALDTEQAKEFINNEHPQSTLKKYKKEFLTNCNESDENKMKLASFCDYYKKEHDFYTNISRKQAAKKNTQRIQTTRVKERYNYLTEGLKTFGKTTLAQFPHMLNTALNYDMVKMQTQNQIQGINNYNTSYMQRLDAINNTINNPFQSTFSLSNWGFYDTGFTYGDHSNFGANQPAVYNQPNPFTPSFTYNPIPTTYTYNPLNLSN